MSAPTPVIDGSTAVINFGFKTTTNGITVTGTGTGTMLLQSAEYSKNADVYEARDGQGNVVSQTFYNQNDEAKLESIVIGSGLADAITQTTIPEVGTIITISACASMTSLVATNWIVQPGISVSGSNTDAKKVTYPLKKYAGITAVAGA